MLADHSGTLCAPKVVLSNRGAGSPFASDFRHRGGSIRQDRMELIGIEIEKRIDI